MIEIKNARELETKFQDLTEFMHGGTIFKKNTKARDMFNKLFSANIRVVYSEKNTVVEPGHIDWGGEWMIMINDKGKAVFLSNSEWCDFSFMK